MKIDILNSIESFNLTGKVNEEKSENNFKDILLEVTTDGNLEETSKMDIKNRRDLFIDSKLNLNLMSTISSENHNEIKKSDFIKTDDNTSFIKVDNSTSDLIGLKNENLNLELEKKQPVEILDNEDLAQLAMLFNGIEELIKPLITYIDNYEKENNYKELIMDSNEEYLVVSNEPNNIGDNEDCVSKDMARIERDIERVYESELVSINENESLIFNKEHGDKEHSKVEHLWNRIEKKNKDNVLAQNESIINEKKVENNHQDKDLSKLSKLLNEIKTENKDDNLNIHDKSSEVKGTSGNLDTKNLRENNLFNNDVEKIRDKKLNITIEDSFKLKGPEVKLNEKLKNIVLFSEQILENVVENRDFLGNNEELIKLIDDLEGSLNSLERLIEKKFLNGSTTIEEMNENLGGVYKNLHNVKKVINSIRVISGETSAEIKNLDSVKYFSKEIDYLESIKKTNEEIKKIESLEYFDEAVEDLKGIKRINKAIKGMESAKYFDKEVRKLENTNYFGENEGGESKESLKFHEGNGIKSEKPSSEVLESKDDLLLKKISEKEDKDKMFIPSKFIDFNSDRVDVHKPEINIKNFSVDTTKSIKHMLKNSMKELVVKVNPGNLGEVTIKISMAEKDIKASITTASKEIYSNINANEIKNLLMNENIKISEVNISLYQEDTTFFNDNNRFMEGNGEHRNKGYENRSGNKELSSFEEDSLDNVEDVSSLNIII